MAKDEGKLQKPQNDRLEETIDKEVFQEEEESDEFDFGGLPSDAPFRRNIGCGG